MPTQVRTLLRGVETVLGDAASDSELFVTEDTEVGWLVCLAGCSLCVYVIRLVRRGVVGAPKTLSLLMTCP